MPKPRNENKMVVKDGAAELRQKWAKVFVSTFADEWVKRFDCSEVILPGNNEFARFLTKAPASAPGPDGLPFAVWKYSGQHGVETLTELELFVRRGHTRWGWILRAVFLPKGNEIGDDIECIRSASDVRPLDLKNCDKAVCTQSSSINGGPHVH